MKNNPLNSLASFFSSGKKNRIARVAPRSAASPAAGGGSTEPIGIIAGNGSFPLRFIAEAKKHGRPVVAVCYIGETDPAVEAAADRAVWIKLGELGKLISAFAGNGVRQAAMVGGINRVQHFGQVKLDLRGAALMMRLRSTQDDVIMRGVADELARDGVEIVDCTMYLKDCLAREGCYTRIPPSEEELRDIEIGIEAIKSVSQHNIGQVVIVREGVIVAVEATEGTNAAIARGGSLGGSGTVVVKFAKPTQDMRFDVPTVGLKTISTMIEAKARVLALESGRCLVLDEEETIRLADAHKITILGRPSLV